jgi:diadenylate cyclase
MRHRAALGITEQADVVAVVVSEETGRISLADNGILLRGLSAQELRHELRTRLATQTGRTATSIWRKLRVHG